MKMADQQRLHRRYLAKSYCVVALSLILLLSCSKLKHNFGFRKDFSETISSGMSDTLPFLKERDNRERRLEKIDAKGNYHGECTTLCNPTGGFSSLIGVISGQCDCVLWIDQNNELYCKSDYENTCCGTLDNTGGVILYIFVVFYSFLALAVICDNYFCESLSRISEALNLSDDVAGATFMAAGSSAPELFTSLVTVLITGGSEGLGTITGSAIFNMMIIVGATAFAACADGSDLPIWWYPLMRDSIMYFISTVAMFIFMVDFQITWLEGLILVLIYGVYVYIMKRNADLAAWAQSIDKEHELKVFNSSRGGQDIEMTSRNSGKRPVDSLRNAVNSNSLESDAIKLRRYTAGNPLFRPEFRSAHGSDRGESTERRRFLLRQSYAQDLGAAVITKRATEALLSIIGKEAKWSSKGHVNGQDVIGSLVISEEEVPRSVLDKCMDCLSKPIEVIFMFTVPDCTLSKWESYFVLTFVMSILWIGILSFIMVDFCVRIGCNVGIPGLLMGLVFIAAGTSVPDALSSVAVGKSGQGDMAVANVLGSNIFNILLGLGLPWFLKAVASGKPYPLNKDEPVAIFTLIMIMYLIGFLVMIQCNGWKLNIQLAKLFFGAHLAFVAFAVIVTFVDIGI